MVDIIATLFKFRQFAFEYGPRFLAAWLGLAVSTALIAALLKKATDLKTPGGPFLRYRLLRWVWQSLLLQLWHPDGKVPVMAAFSGRFFFSLSASIPALVVTSLIDMETAGLRLILAVLYALFLTWFTTRIISPKRGNLQQQSPETQMPLSSLILTDDKSMLPSRGLRTFVQVIWKSFTGQVERALIPLIIGFSLASILTIYMPAYTLRPWLGEGAVPGPYLAAFLAMPFQLTGGAEVPLASALLIKGASLGTALSVMLVAPITTFSVIRHLYRPMKIKTVALYLVATWFVAGSLGVAVDGIQLLITKW